MKEKLKFYSMIMILSGIFGFIYEFIFYFMNSGFKTFYLRGICFMPCIDIYVLGGLLIYLLNKNETKKYKVFLKSGIVCGSLEYLAGLLIYIIFDGKRSWDYNTEILNFGNINGFVCLRSVLFFALSGLILMYILVPLSKKLLNKYNFVGNIFITLFFIFIFDEIYNMLHMFNVINIMSASDFYKSLGFKYMTHY